MTENTFEQSFYAVLNLDTQLYFAGFDTDKEQAVYSSSPFGAKLFSNKNQVKLRPNENLVELIVKLSDDNTEVSEPFRPRRRDPKVHK